MGSRNREPFSPKFEGSAVMDGLLELAGSSFDTEAALARFREAVAKKQRRSDAIPELFEGEPRFPDPALARKLYQNLFGLWELAEEGGDLKVPRPPRVKKAAPTPPEPFAEKGPDGEWVEGCWRYLQEAPAKEKHRLEDGFENRQDALLTFLDEAGLSDDAFGQARYLLFELSAMLELGWPPGFRNITRNELEEAAVSPVPESLSAYAEEALFEAEQDEESPLSADEAKQVRTLVGIGLGALWSVRKVRKLE